MSRSADECRTVRARTSGWVTLCLVVGAGSLIAWVAMALSREDIEAIESPLVLVVARQLEFGGGGLYGPFGGRNPLVLIHAPLYYRLAALAAWPLWRAGFDPVSAALIAGRILSALGFLSTIAAAYGTGPCRGFAGQSRALGGPARSRHTGSWRPAARSPARHPGHRASDDRHPARAVGAQRVTCRRGRVAAAFACFGVALCIKQHFVMAPLISVVLLARAWARGRLGLVSFVRYVLIAMTIVGLYYGTEERMTNGRMSRSILVRRGECQSRSILPIGPSHCDLFLVLSWKCVGLIALLAAAGLAVVSTRPSMVGGHSSAAGTILIGLMVALTVCQFVIVKPTFFGLLVLGLLMMMAVVIPVCVLFERSIFVTPTDVALWAYSCR